MRRLVLSIILALAACRTEPRDERAQPDATAPTARRWTNVLEGPLEAECGSSSKPCKAGQHVYLRVAPDPQRRLVYVFLAGPPLRLIYGPAPLSDKRSSPIPFDIIPTGAHSESGYALKVLRVERPLPIETVGEEAERSAETVSLVVAP